MNNRRSGYLLCHRKSMDAEDEFWLSDPFSRWQARWDLIQMASYGEHLRNGVTLERGQFIASLGFLSGRWQWGKKSVRLFIDRLLVKKTIEKCGVTSTGSIYRIMNYDLYQVPDDEEFRGTPKRHSKGHSKGHSKVIENKEFTGNKGTERDMAKGTPKRHPIRIKGSLELNNTKNKPPPSQEKSTILGNQKLEADDGENSTHSDPSPKPRVSARSIEKVWSNFLEERKKAFREIQATPSKILLTASRRKTLTNLIRDYGEEDLCYAWTGIYKSEYHTGTGRYRGQQTRLGFEALTTINGRINQIEVLQELAGQRKKSSRVVSPLDVHLHEPDPHAYDNVTIFRADS